MEEIKNEETAKKKVNATGILKTVLSAIVILLFVTFAFGAGYMTARNSLDKDIEKIDYILNAYRKYYYDERDDVVDIFADALLDEYSDYLTREEYAEINASYVGSKFGIGCVISQERKENEEYEIVVDDVFGNSPCQKAGLKEGDKLVSIRKEKTGEAVALSSLASYFAVINEIGDGVEFYLDVLRGDEIVEIAVAKEDYTQTFVKYYDNEGEYGFFDIDGKIGFDRICDNTLYPLGEEDNDVAVIRYRSFSGRNGGINGSIGQFERVMKKFKEDGKKDLVLDLRGNGGGLIDIMNGVVRHFIDVEKGKKVKTIVYRDKHEKEEYYYSYGSLYSDYGFENIVILADRDTASAAEAFIGAVLDYDEDGIVKVVVSGGRTYGKGIMQNTYSRPAGDAIRLTTAKLFWPTSNRCVHGVGITTETDERVVNETQKGAAFYDALSLCR